MVGPIPLLEFATPDIGEVASVLDFMAAIISQEEMLTYGSIRSGCMIELSARTTSPPTFFETKRRILEVERTFGYNNRISSLSFQSTATRRIALITRKTGAVRESV